MCAGGGGLDPALLLIRGLEERRKEVNLSDFVPPTMWWLFDLSKHLRNAAGGTLLPALGK